MLGQIVVANYSCHDGTNGSGLLSCDGSAPSGQPVDTSTVGTHTFTVTATSTDGQRTQRTIAYHVDRPTNQFTIKRISSGRNGQQTLLINVPGPGEIDLLETAWLSQRAHATALLRPAPGRFVLARTNVRVSAAGTIGITIRPNTRGQQLVDRLSGPITVRLWASYTPRNGTQRNIAIYGLPIAGPHHGN
jgi:hypothetical protein